MSYDEWDTELAKVEGRILVDEPGTTPAQAHVRARMEMHFVHGPRAACGDPRPLGLVDPRTTMEMEWEP